MILVVGATGLVGGEVCRRLAGRGESVRALVRGTSDPSRVAALQAAGVTTVLGDLREPASLRAACEGVSTVVSTVSSMPFSYQPGVNDIETVDRSGVMSLIDAAKATGADRFVYVSFSRNLQREYPLCAAKRSVEDHLRASGLAYTILRPSYFMEVWLSPAAGFDPEAATATIFGSGERAISWISLADVAEFAVLSLDAPTARDATIELGGPEAITLIEAVEVFERISGRTFERTYVPEAALEERWHDATDPMAASFAALMRCAADGDPIPMGATLRDIPMTMTTIEGYAERVLGVVPAGIA